MNNEICPICKEKNECFTSTGQQGICWCYTEEFPNEIFELVPIENRRKSCICKKCLNKYKEEQEMKKPFKELL